MTNENENYKEAGLVRSQSAALSHIGTATLASRGMKDLLAREDAEQWLKRGSKFLAQHKYEEAVRCFERGLQLNPTHARLQCYLALAYYKGLGVPQDYAQAAIWWRRAAEQGNVLAQCELAATYDKGLGVPQDYVQAAIWWRRAAEQGNAFAQYKLGLAYDRALGVPDDYTQAAIWWRRAAEQGYSIAEYRLGVAYYFGDGVPQDYVQAAIWWRRAAEQGDKDARQALDDMEHGREGDKWPLGGIFS
jgi:TPR repeat protein